MGIEVRQLVVKSSVESSASSGCGDDDKNANGTNKALLEECRKMILDILREQRER